MTKPLDAIGVEVVDSAASPLGSGKTGIWVKTSDGLPYFQKADNSSVAMSAAGAGTVSSVALSLPSIITVSGSPVTSSGTLTGVLATQTANTLFAGPTSGGVTAPTFRALVAADVSALVPLLTDWIITPVGDANAIPVTTWGGFGGDTSATRFTVSRSCSCTGVRFHYPDTSSKSIKVSLWNAAGTRLKTATAAYNSAGIKSLSFGSTQALTAFQTYYVSTWETTSSLALGYGCANSLLNFGAYDADTYPHFPGSPIVFWESWGYTHSGGDAFPNGVSASVINPIDPILTVP